MARQRFTFIRPCIKCEKLFKPSGKYTNVCDECKRKMKIKRYGSKK